VGVAVIALLVYMAYIMRKKQRMDGTESVDPSKTQDTYRPANPPYEAPDFHHFEPRGLDNTQMHELKAT